MTTDKEKLEALLKEFEITPINPDNLMWAPGYATGNDLMLASGVGGVEGYSMFYCLFKFDEDGSFKSVGVWE